MVTSNLAMIKIMCQIGKLDVKLLRYAHLALLSGGPDIEYVEVRFSSIKYLLIRGVGLIGNNLVKSFNQPMLLFFFSKVPF